MPVSLNAPGRRVLLAFAALALVPLAFFAFRPSEAEARGVWCAGDPAIIVNGALVDVNVHVPLDRLWYIDYVEVVFHVPADASVTAVINDSLLFEARASYVKDLPAMGRGGLLSSTEVRAEIVVHHRGRSFDIGATTAVTGWGTRLWQQGRSDVPLWVDAASAYSVALLDWGIQIR
jgi:hypothetical protein